MTTGITFQSWSSDNTCRYQHSVELSNSVSSALSVSCKDPGVVSDPVPLVVGRNFVKYLIDNNLASEIRVADKRVAFMAFLK